MSFQEVFHYWCNPFTCYAIDYDTLRKSTTPIIIEGARGSGKTMILKYISYFCQKEKILSSIGQETLIETIIRDGSLGIYFRYKDDLGSLFKYLNCSQEYKNQLFLYYFDLYILYELFKILSDLEKYDSMDNGCWTLLNSKLCDLFNINEIKIGDLCLLIEQKIQNVDSWVRKSRYIDKAEEQLSKIIEGTNYFINTCNIIKNCIPKFEKLKFLIIIDEYENVNEYQYLLNTLIKRVDHTINVTYRIGVRPKGIKTLNTNIGTEFLQIDRDFLLYSLQSHEMFKYKKFIMEIANSRLKSIDFFSENKLTDITVLLGKKENIDKEASAVTKNRPEKHFEILKKKFGEDEYKKVVSAIKNPQKPLMEMLNILWVLRGNKYEKVVDAMNIYLSNKNKKNIKKDGTLAYKYKLDYSDKYRLQLLYVLLGMFGQNKKYYSFNTFVYLSSGAINDFISLCRNVFYLLDESYYDNVNEFREIPISIQTIGAENTAIEQIDKVRLCNENGAEMYCYAMNIGNLFKMYHRDIHSRYPETNQFAFENDIEIENRPILKDVRNSLIKWGVIIKKSRIQSVSIGKRKGNLYYLNRIFSPIFCISIRTRGGYNFIIDSDLFEVLLKESLEPEKIKSWKKISKNIKTEKKSLEEPDNKQLSLFEVADYE